MGSSLCCDDSYKQITQKYGKQFKQFVVRQKSKTFLFRSFDKLKRNVSYEAQKEQNILMGQIRIAQEQVEEYYGKVVKELEERQPGGIKALEQMSQNKAEQILGYNQIKNYMERFRQGLKNDIKNEENNIISDLTTITTEFQQEYQQKQSQNIKLMDEIPQKQRQMMMKRAQMDYQSEISKAQEYLLNQYDQELNIEKYQERFTHNNCRQQLSKLVNLSKDKLLTNLNTILSETISNYILIK